MFKFIVELFLSFSGIFFVLLHFFLNFFIDVPLAEHVIKLIWVEMGFERAFLWESDNDEGFKILMLFLGLGKGEKVGGFLGIFTIFFWQVGWTNE